MRNYIYLIFICQVLIMSACDSNSIYSSKPPQSAIDAAMNDMNNMKKIPPNDYRYEIACDTPLRECKDYTNSFKKRTLTKADVANGIADEWLLKISYLSRSRNDPSDAWDVWGEYFVCYELTKNTDNQWKADYSTSLYDSLIGECAEMREAE